MIGSLPVSVLMAVFNGEKHVAASVESILSQSFGDFEFIIVDDGSTDGTADKILQYKDPRILFSHNKQNIGLTRSLNIALRRAAGNFLARQDADDISMVSRFEQQVAFLENHSEVALLGTGAQYLDVNDRVLGQAPLPGDPTMELLDANPFIHGSVMFRRSIAIELGGYDEFFRYCQDYEFWGRIARVHRVAILPENLYCFRQHINSTRFRNGYQSSLYQLLANKMIRRTIRNDAVSDIKSNGISRVFDYLERPELAFHHKAAAHTYMKIGEIKKAKKEYKSALEAAPLNVRNILNLVLVYCGRQIWGAFHGL